MLGTCVWGTYFKHLSFITSFPLQAFAWLPHAPEQAKWASAVSSSISNCFLYVSLDEHPRCSWKQAENSRVLPDPRTTGKPARQPSKVLLSSKLLPQALQHLQRSGPLPGAWPPPADYKLPGAKNFLASPSGEDQASVNACEQKELSLFNKEQQLIVLRSSIC